MLLEILLVFILNIAGSTLKVLNTLFLSKRILKPVYIIMFIDAIVFMTGIKMVTEGESFIFILAFAFGKVIGTYLASQIESKMAFGILEVVVYAKTERAIQVADGLRELGYGVTTMKGYGLQGNPRFSINVTIQRKELKFLKEVLSKYGYSEATLVIRELNGIEGKIKTSTHF